MQRQLKYTLTAREVDLLLFPIHKKIKSTDSNSFTTHSQLWTVKNNNCMNSSVLWMDRCGFTYSTRLQSNKRKPSTYMVPISLQLCIPGISVYLSALVFSMKLHNSVNVPASVNLPSGSCKKKDHKNEKPTGEKRSSNTDLLSMNLGKSDLIVWCC